MKDLIKLLVICMTFCGHFAFANIDQIFSEFYYSPEISSRHCGRNISNFIKELAKLGYEHKDIRILYITAPYHPWSFGRVVAVNSRWGNLIDGNAHQNWEFHVIALIDKKAYDFSFNDSPKILNFNEYLESMFIPKNQFAINGETFRVRDEGPYYNSTHAKKELPHYRVKIFQSDKNGVLNAISEEMTLADFMNSEI
jgi:hypothetical protein